MQTNTSRLTFTVPSLVCLSYPPMLLLESYASAMVSTQHLDLCQLTLHSDVGPLGVLAWENNSKCMTLFLPRLLVFSSFLGYDGSGVEAFKPTDAGIEATKIAMVVMPTVDKRHFLFLGKGRTAFFLFCVGVSHLNELLFLLLFFFCECTQFQKKGRKNIHMRQIYCAYLQIAFTTWLLRVTRCSRKQQSNVHFCVRWWWWKGGLMLRAKQHIILLGFQTF